MGRLLLLLPVLTLYAGALVAPNVGAQSAQAQSAEPRIVSEELTPAAATVGDRLTMTIVVEHGRGIVVTGPQFDGAYGGLDIVEIAPPEIAQDGKQTTLRYVFAAFEVAAYVVPEQSLSYQGNDVSGTLRTTEQRVAITTVLSPGDTDLRPLKPQLEIEDPAPPPLVPIAIVAAFAALTAAGYWLVRRAMALPPPPAAMPTPPREPHVAARAALDALHADPTASLNARYAGIALILRRYLSERFGFAAYAMTRRELERGMTRAGIDRWPARLTANLLEQCDAVQFAGFVPAMERIDADLTAAYEIVALTAPAPVDAEAAVATAAAEVVG